MLLSRTKQIITAMHHPLSPAVSTNRNYCLPTTHHHHPRPLDDVDNDYDDVDEPSVNNQHILCSNPTTTDLLMMMMADAHRPSSFVTCNTWTFDDARRSPSPRCSSTSNSPQCSDDQVTTTDDPSFATPLMSSCNITDDNIIQEPRKESSTCTVTNIREVDGTSKNSIGTSNYYGDDDGGRLQAVTEEQEEETPEINDQHKHINNVHYNQISSGSGSCDGSVYENSDIESAMEEETILSSTTQSRRPKNNLAAKLSAWKEARTTKIVNKLRKAEAVIDEWAKNEAKKAKMEMKEFERKLERRREEEMKEMQKRIKIAQKEAERKKMKKRATAENKIAKVEQVFEKAENTGKLSCWLLFL